MRPQSLRAWLLSLVLLILGAAVALRLSHARNPESEREVEAPPVIVDAAVARRKPIQSAVSVPGFLRPLPNAQSRVAAQVAGRISRVLVKPGDSVRAGQLLATVARPELRSNAMQARAAVREAERDLDALQSDRFTRRQTLLALERHAAAALAAAQAHYDLVRAGSRPEEIDRAQAAVDTAQADLERLLAGPREQETAQALAAVRDARANLDSRQKDYNRKKSLLERGFVAAQEVDRAEADLASARAAFETREEQVKLLRAGSRPEEIKAQEARLRELKAQLKEAKAGSRPQEIRVAEGELLQARAEMEQARAARTELGALDQRIRAAGARIDAARQQQASTDITAGRTDIRSPLDGIVAQVLVGPGDGIAEQSPLVVITSPRAYRAIIQIPTAVRSHVHRGAPVEISVPGAGFRQRTAIRALLSETDRDTGLGQAEVWLSDPRRQLADGMAVDARLFMPARPALLVPTRSISAREGEKTVMVISDDSVKVTQIQAGPEQGDFTEVTAGLREGAVVVLDGSLTLPDGARVEFRK